MKNSKFIINKLSKIFEQGLISSKDLTSELLNILKSKRDEIVFKMKLTSKDEFDILISTDLRGSKYLEKNKKTQIEASQLDLIGSNFSKMHLHSPKIRMPLMNGYLWLATKEAFIDQGRNEALDIKDVIYLEGLVDGRQLKGTAQALSMQAGAQHCDLSDADFIWGKQHVTVKVLRLRSGSVLEGEQWHEKPVQDSAAIQ